jgi:hypothetical protein
MTLYIEYASRPALVAMAGCVCTAVCANGVKRWVALPCEWRSGTHLIGCYGKINGSLTMIWLQFLGFGQLEND